MAIIEINCVGNTWQDDFAPHIPALSGLFSRCFRNYGDREELAWNALLLFMEDVRRRWEPGTSFRLSTTFAVMKVTNGVRYMNRTGNHSRSKTRPRMVNLGDRLIHTVRARIEARDNWIDLKDVISRLSEEEQGIVHMAIQGYDRKTIQRTLHIHHRRVLRVLTEVVAKLS